MNTLEVQTKINQKLSRLSPEQLGVVWNFVESLETSSIPVTEEAPRKTILERMGELPEFSLHGGKDLSDRDVRKKIIAEKIRHKHQERHQ